MNVEHYQQSMRDRIQAKRAEVAEARSKLATRERFLAVLGSADFGALVERLDQLLFVVERAVTHLPATATLGEVMRTLGRADGIREVSQALRRDAAERAVTEARDQANRAEVELQRMEATAERTGTVVD